MDNTKAIGNLGETLAVQALVKRGYEIVERNWHGSRGEVDIICRDGPCWVFVEVKTRHGHASGLPEDGLTQDKIERLTALAQTYLAQHEIGDVSWRLDLVAIELDRQNRVGRFNLIPGVGVE
ncbi:MAG: YraN family protein [Chloroflexota bacterium]|nr:YraN family protein [Chloroflexota bacterium]